MRSKRLFSGLGRAGFLAITIAILLVAGVAYAATLTVGDGFVDGSGNYIPGSALPVLVAQSDSASSCAVRQSMVALKFDLGSISSGTTVNTATLTVHVVGASLPGTGTLSVVPVSNTSFTSGSGGTLSLSNFDLTSPLAAISFGGVAAGNDLVLRTPQLAAYFNGKRGEQAAVGLVISSCTSGTPPSIQFTSSSGTTGLHPTLALLGPNAVTLTTLRASGDGMDWPVMVVAGCFGLATMGAGMRRFRRRRAVN